jgi:dienelactone hydrolase
MAKIYNTFSPKLSLTLFILISILFSSCNKSNTAVYDISSLKENKFIELTKWNVVGPIKLSDSLRKNDFLNFDHLKILGTTENNFLKKPFKKIDYSNPDALIPKAINQEFYNYKYNAFDFNIVRRSLNEKGKNIIGSAIYFSSKIHSNKQDTINFISKSSDGLKVWVNSKLVYQSKERRPFNLNYLDYVTIPISRGENLITVKKINYSNKVYFKAILAKDSLRDKLFHKKQSLCIFEKSIAKDTIFLPQNFSEILNSSLEYTIKDNEGKIIYKQKIDKEDKPEIDISSLPNDKSYLCSFTKNNLVFSQVFYKGDPDDALLFLKKRREKFLTNKNAVKQIDTYLYRLKALLEHPSRYKDWYWSHKISYLLYELDIYMNSLKTPDPNLALSTGIQFKAYTSKIDESTQHYLIITPDSYSKKKPIPLVVVIKPNNKNHHHFLTSAQVARKWSLSWAKYLANKYNYAVLLPSARLYLDEYLVPISETEIINTIEDVEKNFNIDSSRIYLHGNCSAGIRSLTLAGHYPDKFAGIGLYSPTYMVNSNNSWLRNNSPKNLLNNLKNTPIFIHYDPTDTHNPYTSFEKLITSCKEEKFNLTVSSSHLSSIYYNVYLVGEEAFTFFKDKKVNRSPKKIEYKSYNEKYNKSFWLKFEKEKDKSNLEISSDFNTKNNTLDLYGENVSNIEIDLKELPFNDKEQLTINFNEREIYSNLAQKKALVFNLNKKQNNSIDLEVKDKNIIDLFGDSFVVIANPKDFTNRQLLDSIKNEYENYYFSEFPIYSSHKIKHLDLSSKNILFIGHDFKNIEIKNLISKLNFEVKSDQIKIDNKIYKGKNIAFMKIYKNPYNSSKLVCVYSSNNLKSPKHKIQSPWNKIFSDLVVN